VMPTLHYLGMMTYDGLHSLNWLVYYPLSIL
jgi:hypothetical protein